MIIQVSCSEWVEPLELTEKEREIVLNIIHKIILDKAEGRDLIKALRLGGFIDKSIWPEYLFIKDFLGVLRGEMKMKTFFKEYPDKIALLLSEYTLEDFRKWLITAVL